MSASQGGPDLTPPTGGDGTVPAPPDPEPAAGVAPSGDAPAAESGGGAIDVGGAGGSGDDGVDEEGRDDEFDAERLASEGTGSGQAPQAGSGQAPQAAPTGGLGPGQAEERFGHLIRHYRMGVSGAALALAWARQENAPDGATVVVEREVSPLGRLGRMWSTPPESTLSLAVVVRPPLKVEEADAIWLLAALAAAEGAEVASGRKLATWWPDLVIDAESGDEVAALKVEIQLGPGRVKSAVASIRIDLDKLGLGADGRDAVLEAVLAALDSHSRDLGEGAAGVAAAYDGRFGMLGRRIKLRLLPKGEARGLARGVDRSARLQLESATGMVQKVAIDTLRDVEAV